MDNEGLWGGLRLVQAVSTVFQRPNWRTHSSFLSPGLDSCTGTPPDDA